MILAGVAQLGRHWYGGLAGMLTSQACLLSCFVACCEPFPQLACLASIKLGGKLHRGLE